MEKGLLFTYLLTYGGALVSLFNPFIGLLIYICFAIIRPDSMWYWSVPTGNYARIVAISLLVGWAMQGFGNWRFGRARAVVGVLIAFWIWSAFSAARAMDQQAAWVFVEGRSKIFLPFLVGITTIDSLRKLKQLAWVIVLSQGYVALELNRTYYGGFNRVWEIGFGDMDNNCVAIAMVTGVGMAFFLGLGVPTWWRKALAFAAAGLMANTVFFSFSRGGMLALAVTGVLAIVLTPKKPKHYLFLVLAILIGLRLAGKEVQERFSTIFVTEENRDESAQSRVDLWRSCIKIMREQPLGIGPDHFPLIAHQFGFPEGKHAHTMWLQLGAELGIPGLVLLILFFWLCVVRLWPLARGAGTVPDPWFRDAARMIIAAVIGFMVAAQFVTVYGLELPYYVVLVGAGVLKLVSLHVPAPPLPAPSTLERRVAEVVRLQKTRAFTSSATHNLSVEGT